MDKLDFNPCLLRKDEFLKEAKTFNYVDVDFNQKTIELHAKFTLLLLIVKFQ